MQMAPMMAELCNHTEYPVTGQLLPLRLAPRLSVNFSFLCSGLERLLNI